MDAEKCGLFQVLITFEVKFIKYLKVIVIVIGYIFYTTTHSFLNNLING